MNLTLSYIMYSFFYVCGPRMWMYYLSVSGA